MVKVPSSKSISNRMLVIQHLCDHTFPLEYLSEATDTKELAACLSAINNPGSGAFYINAGEGGTSVRFLLALLCITKGKWLLDCSGSFRKRPVKPLVDALRLAGADIRESCPDFYPLEIHGKDLGPEVLTVDNTLSSQFISALLIIAPYFMSDTCIKPLAPPLSQPYINLTMSLMLQSGCSLRHEGDAYFVAKGVYSRTTPFYVEGDWSAAAFWLALAAIRRRGVMYVESLALPSHQGDSFGFELFQKLGITPSLANGRMRILPGDLAANMIEVDFTHHPDLALPFAVACASLAVSARLTGLSSLEHKESKRLTGICNAFNQCGVRYERIENSCLQVFPSVLKDTFSLNTHADHRLAMSFALFSAAGKKVIIDHPECVDKSYPDFWIQFKAAGFALHDVD
jgi:3-phosphoshikimate 1-carboxyvinyltransferase